MYRYAEGFGTAARFHYITDIDFLSSTELICADKRNHCLRYVGLSLSPPETSTFAGNCTVSGNADGHQVNSALFFNPMYAEVDSNNSIVYVLVHDRDALHKFDHETLRVIDLRTDNVTTLVTFDTQSYDMKILEDSLLYLAQGSRVAVFNISSGEENAIGSFKISAVYGLLPWRNEVKKTLLVANMAYERFANCSYNVMIKVFSLENIDVKVLITATKNPLKYNFT